MIRVTFLENESGKLRGFQAKGHAGYALEGDDIVCAGVSTLIQAAAAGLEKFLSEQVHLTERLADPQDVFVKLMLPEALSGEEEKAARVILETLELGMRGVAGSYGKYLEVRRCRDELKEV